MTTLSLLLGTATGIRSTAGFAILASAKAAPEHSPFADDRIARALRAALVAETLADKTGTLPPRTDPVPLAGRALLGAASAILAARWTGRSPGAAALVGACAAVGTAWAATALRATASPSESPKPALEALAALGEDLVVVKVAATAARLLRLSAGR